MDDIPSRLILSPRPHAQDTAAPVMVHGLAVDRGRPLYLCGGGSSVSVTIFLGIVGMQDVATVLVLAVFEEAKDAAMARARARVLGDLQGFGTGVGVNFLPHGGPAAFAVRPGVLLGCDARPVFGWVVVDEDLVGGVGNRETACEDLHQYGKQGRGKGSYAHRRLLAFCPLHLRRRKMVPGIGFAGFAHLVVFGVAPWCGILEPWRFSFVEG